MPTSTNTVTYHYNKARKLAFLEVERLARNILRINPTLEEFVIGMGSYLFTIKESSRGVASTLILENTLGGKEEALSSIVGYKKLINFISLWDDIFKLTGEPMRFTAKGKKITNW